MIEIISSGLNKLEWNVYANSGQLYILLIRKISSGVASTRCPIVRLWGLTIGVIVSFPLAENAEWL